MRKLETILAMVGAFVLLLWLMGTFDLTQFRLYVGDDFKTFCAENP